MSESVCFIIILSVVYSKLEAINTPFKAEERRKERKGEVKEGKKERVKKIKTKLSTL